jgi:site-specific DNA-methyltransferase (adenine-specific)
MEKLPENEIICADCVKWLNEAAKTHGRFSDLIFADPPFNIGYDYKGQYKDKLKYDDYVSWTREWMTACRRVLKPAGSFWIAIGDEYAAEVRMIAREMEQSGERDERLFLRNWVIWHYTFGQATKLKFARSHTHLFYFVADEKNFAFNADPVRVISDRMREYNDARAWKHGKGKLPDDVWLQFPRVCGTFKEREGWHTAQMPEALMSRILRACSNPGDLVLDPFSGSGVTACTAAKLGRRALAIEKSGAFAREGNQRLANAVEHRSAYEANPRIWSEFHDAALLALYSEAELPLDVLQDKAELCEVFARLFSSRLPEIRPPFTGDEILSRLAGQNILPKIRIFADAANRPATSRRRSRQGADEARLFT